jgi:exodeoxyribonuclease VII small subunit
LEGEGVDVDELAAKVKRASELIQLCRDRLKGARLEIQQVVADLEGFDEDEGGGGA